MSTLRPQWNETRNQQQKDSWKIPNYLETEQRISSNTWDKGEISREIFKYF